jgi:hypothetical protein
MGQTTGGAGFRLDAIKHMDRKFLLQWVSVSTKVAIALPVVFMGSRCADQTGAYARWQVAHVHGSGVLVPGVSMFLPPCYWKALMSVCAVFHEFSHGSRRFKARYIFSRSVSMPCVYSS